VKASPAAVATEGAVDLRAVQFRFVAAVPAHDPPGWFAHYDHVPTAPAGWRLADVRGAIDERILEWLDGFDAWHERLGAWAAIRSPIWWLTRGSRPNVWGQRGVLKPLVFAAGLLEWVAAAAPAGAVYVVGTPPEVKDYVDELRGTPGVAAARGAGTVRGLAIALVDAARRLQTLVRAYVTRPAPAVRARAIFYSHVVDAGALAASGDHFFGTMVDAAETGEGGGVLLAYVLHVDAQRHAAEATLRAAGRHACFVLDFLTWGDVAWIVRELVRWPFVFARTPRHLPPVRMGRWTSRSFVSRYFAGEVRRWIPVDDLAVDRAMRRLLASSGARVVVYPYEEKGLERGIVDAARRRDVGTLAYGHAAHARTHLALRTRRTGLNPPGPEMILATGPQAARFLVEWGGKAAEQVVAVGSPRHFTPRARPSGGAARRARVLVIITHGFELAMFVNFVETRPDIAAAHEVLVRTYRFGWHGEQDAAVRRLRTIAPSIRVEGDATLAEHVTWCDVAVFASTTAGVQAMLAGRVGVYAALHDVFPADPLQGLDGIFARCHDAGGLAAALAEAAALDDAAYARVVARQLELASSILAPLDEAGVAKALELAANRGRHARP
jgi:hypothetical protein